jgi:hypothetical protein
MDTCPWVYQPRTDFELFKHAVERKKRREELKINRIYLQESNVKLENEKMEFLKQRCKSDEAKANVEKQRLLNDSIRQRNEEKRLELDIEKHNMEKEQDLKCLTLWALLLRN